MKVHVCLLHHHKSRRQQQEAERGRLHSDVFLWTTTFQKGFGCRAADWASKQRPDHGQAFTGIRLYEQHGHVSLTCCSPIRLTHLLPAALLILGFITLMKCSQNTGHNHVCSSHQQAGLSLTEAQLGFHLIIKFKETSWKRTNMNISIIIWIIIIWIIVADNQHCSEP